MSINQEARGRLRLWPYMAYAGIIGGMEVSAVTAFLREYRILKKINQKDLAEAIDLSPRQTNRWENDGTVSLKQEQLLRAINYLEAPLPYLAKLSAEDATAADGIRLAKQAWLEHLEKKTLEAAPNLTRDEHIQLLVEMAQEMKEKDPSLLERLIGKASLMLRFGEPAQQSQG